MGLATERSVTLPTGVQKNRRFETLFQLLDRAGTSCEVILPTGQSVCFGEEPRIFRLQLNSEQAFRRGFNQLAIAESYVNGEYEIEGDMYRVFDLRNHLKTVIDLPLRLKHFSSFLFQSLVSANKQAIESHYSLGDDFFLSFLDQRYRLYSQGLFRDETETLEQASENKLQTMYETLQLKPGMHLLDIGGGWGGVAEFCGPRGVQVTELTVADDSFAFIRNLIDQKGLAAEVIQEDFLVHEPAVPYDAACIFGVVEHIPNYGRFSERIQACLKPGGRLYIDMSASKVKHTVSAFSRRYIWSGAHTFGCLQALLRALLYQGMDILSLENETRDYELTMRHWTTRFEASREEIIRRWGERLYRAFRFYLWGGAHALNRDVLQAYHVVARRRTTPGQQTNGVLRLLGALGELV